jgi:hypothetical protein
MVGACALKAIRVTPTGRVFVHGIFTSELPLGSRAPGKL